MQRKRRESQAEISLFASANLCHSAPLRQQDLLKQSLRPNTQSLNRSIS